MMRHAFVFRGLLALSLVANLGACATTWVITQTKAGRPPLQENEKSEEVPLPGTTETLTITLHLYGRAQTASTTTTASSTTVQDTLDSGTDPSEPFFACEVSQRSTSKVYQAATRYGKRWKQITALSFVAEAAIATLFLTDLRNDMNELMPGRLLYGAWMGADALGTAILFFVPRKDVYEISDKTSTLIVRNDCPENLIVDIDGRTVPVNALGGIGELGRALLERHIVQSAGALRLQVGEHTAELFLETADRCLWARTRKPDVVDSLCPSTPTPTGDTTGATDTTGTGAATPTSNPAWYAGRQQIPVKLEVPPGTLSSLPIASPEPAP